MTRAGITGGIGSGKSICCRIFSLLGTPVYYADERAQALIHTPGPLQDQLRETFGNTLFTSGNLDRKALAEIVFHQPGQLERLNSIVHPYVYEDYIRWDANQKSPYTLLETAILFESGFHRFMDRVILVSAPEEVRIRRVTLRDKVSRDEVISRMNNQWPEEKKKALAGDVILNDDIHPLIPQILTIHESLCRV